jgi:hypothetical protein
MWQEKRWETSLCTCVPFSKAYSMGLLMINEMYIINSPIDDKQNVGVVGQANN